MKIETQQELRAPAQDFCTHLMMEKYALPGETSEGEIHARVAGGLATSEEQRRRFIHALQAGFVPGGRINRSIGSGLDTTAINCFVQEVGDSMSGKDKNGVVGITDALAQAAETMRRGGGVGYNFSRIRPMGALVRGTASRASGPVSYMRMFDKMCETVESAGARRGAQMGVLRVDHPDIELFIDAKRTPDWQGMGLDDKEVASLMGMIRNKPSFGWTARKAFSALSNFNLSVAVTNEFMTAVVEDGDFDLVHEVEPYDGSGVEKTLADGTQVFIYKKVRAKDLWHRIMKNTYEGAEPGVIFIDRVAELNNLWYAERIEASNPCGEQMLPSYGCCDLGSLMLQRFVFNAFTDEASFDFEGFGRAVHVAVEILDAVLDNTKWPLPQQQVEAESKRRIGTGYLGLADAMAMLGIRYNSPEAVRFTVQVGTVLRDEAYRASVQLAIKLGAFPLFDADKYLKPGTFASTLPLDIQEGIRKHGIRNSHLLSIAPTGTISMAFGDNASSGIEPIFSLRQERTKLMADGQRDTFVLESGAFRAFKRARGADASTDVFVTALQMSVDDHLAILEAAAPLVDSAISKTVNVPSDYPFEYFAGIYLRAWKAGLKGITTYRPSDMLGSVIADADEKKPGSELPSSDPDRRVELKDASQVLSALRWPSRPKTPQGIESVTYSVSHPQGDFAVVVGHVQNGTKHPVEVYIAGNEQPRGLAAIAKVLSVDMRTGDPAWLQMKLDSLSGTEGDDAFEMHDPRTGDPVRVPSLVSGFSRLVGHRLESIGALEPKGDESMVGYLFSKREPKTGPQGAIGWHVDVRNPVTGDDFLLHLKEVRMEDGTVRPYSMWLSGKYPKVLDGLTKLLSIDMRVSNPQWVLKKLRSLLSFGELRGDFLAQVPGEVRQQNYPSTVAYLADLIIGRYRVLGLIGEDFQTSAAPAAETVATGFVDGSGLPCPSCHTMNLHRKGGCKSCDACGYQGECG